MVPSPGGLAPFQFAFVVRDLDHFVGELDRLLMAGPWPGWVFGPQGQGREYRGAPAEWTLRLALNSRSPQFEVIQPLDGPSVHADWLEERGEGFHHVGYVVPSLEQQTAKMEAAGHPVIARIHSFGADRDGAAAYYDTADTLGFLVEAVEPPARMRRRTSPCNPSPIHGRRRSSCPRSVLANTTRRPAADYRVGSITDNVIETARAALPPMPAM